MCGSMKHSGAHDEADPQPQALGRQLETVSSRDLHRLQQRWRRLGREPDAAKLAALAADIERSATKRRERAAAKPRITLDAALPISTRSDDIIALIRKHQVVVIAGETGSGKTTQLPKLCLAAGRGEAGMIGCTQPRRLAARSMARRVAEELGTQVGDIVGFQVRFTDQVSERSLIKFMTDGILLAETQHDPWLSAYDTLIIDEAHERSLNIDFLLGYLKRLALKRPDLKIIVTSATIDTARFAEHYGGAPVVQVEGRTYPVEVRWRGEENREQNRGQSGLSTDGSVLPLSRQSKVHSDPGFGQGSAEHVTAVLDEITRTDPRGDVLVFLPGEREIRDAHQLLSRRQYRATEVLPLYARLSARDQDRVFKPGALRRIVLATNVAETSLTVPRIRYVVDTGTARVKRYSRRSQLERLHVEPISQAAADQRKGRCGRVGPGVCYRLYDEADFAARPAFTDPELLRSSLANVILRMLALKLGAVDDFPFLEAPDPRVVADGYRRLAEVSAIDDERRLTPIGRTLARWPIDVQLARILVEAQRLRGLREALVIVAFLSVQDPRERPAEARAQADAAHKTFADTQSDFVGMLNLWRAYRTAHEDLTQSKLRDWCSRHFLSFMRMREWSELHRQLLATVADLGWSVGEKWNQSRLSTDGPIRSPPRTSKVDSGSTFRPDHIFEAIHRSILSGLPTLVGRKDERGAYQGPRERKFQVFPGSALAKTPPNWMCSAQIIDVGGRVWAMTNARVDPLWIEQQAAHLLRTSCRDPHWSKRRGAVVAFQQVSLFGLVLAEQRPVLFHQQDPALAHEIFVRDALVRGEVGEKWNQSRLSASRAGNVLVRRSKVDSGSTFPTFPALLRANRRVLQQAEEQEAKQRRGGLLRHEDELVAFFIGKLPEDISSMRAFEAWYRQASPAAQAALHWSLDDVLSGATGPDAAAFPPQLEADGQRYRLEYRFVPGDAADGVTLHVPLALLNALPAARCEWLVPGLLVDKVAELIRGLPKSLRRNFVPAPDFARAFVAAEAPREEALAQVLAAFLQRTTGVAVGAADFAAVDLPAHLQMRFELHDEAARGQAPRALAASRDLAALRARWQARARTAFAGKTDLALSDTEATRWDFGHIPGQVAATGGLTAYPALVDLGDAVALRVFERAEAAQAAHRAGVTRLLRHALAAAAKAARRRLPISQAVALKYLPLGTLEDLRHDLVEGAFADVLAGHALDVRDAGAFADLCAQAQRELVAASIARLELAEAIIEAHAQFQSWRRPARPGFAGDSYADLEEQHDALLAPGFLRTLPRARLAQLPRYLKAMRLRAERLRQDPAKDRQRLLQVLPYWRAWLRHRAADVDVEVLDELRWLLEEWRVSLFAQELKTAEPVSAKRLAAALARLEQATGLPT